MFDVATAHALGHGAEFSPSLAFDWLQKARESGHLLTTVAIPNDETNADAACQFLRKQGAQTTSGTPPPLDRELNPRIAAAQASGRKALTVVHQTRARYPEDKRRAGVAVLWFQVDPRGQPHALSVAKPRIPRSPAPRRNACVSGASFGAFAIACPSPRTSNSPSVSARPIDQTGTLLKTSARTADATRRITPPAAITTSLASHRWRDAAPPLRTQPERRLCFRSRGGLPIKSRVGPVPRSSML